MEILLAPWPWYIAGSLIAFVMFMLLYFGQNFGMSSNLRTMCTIVGGNRYCDFFDFDWKKQRWNLMFVVGAIIGGYIAANYLTLNTAIELHQDTVKSLLSLGFSSVGDSYLPHEIFGIKALFSVKGIAVLLIGGYLVGFGARYAGGCTSGHAISGLSDFQIPSLIAVIGFFIGGLITTHLIIPFLF